MVTDQKFPFPPLGILHKKEEIRLIKKLRIGEWLFNCQIGDFVQLENGIEFNLRSNSVYRWRAPLAKYNDSPLRKLIPGVIQKAIQSSI